jgi:drug/metabolite transporter (DMT)-like permease
MLVVIAFAIVYIVWGSTYFFIRIAVQHIPPMLVGMLRYLIAGVLMIGWCLIRREAVFSRAVIGPAFVSGFLLLCGGNGILIWTEQYIPSSLAAVLLASGPVWFVLLDRGQWGVNFRSKSTRAGLGMGFVGVLLLFVQRLEAKGDAVSAGARAVVSGGGRATLADASGRAFTTAMLVLLIGSISWAAGSLYSKYRSAQVANSVNTGWQMLLAGLVFLPVSWVSGEWKSFHFSEVPFSSWMAILYLVTMGSLAGYSAFVWLLQVRPATQVSTHAYVNPVVAVLLGVFFLGESLTTMQFLGLVVILTSVLLINLAKYRKRQPREVRVEEPGVPEKTNV